ncbi:MAG TPA: thiamine pyrophosphate-dependent enzyme [Nitrolancea sp.]|nr:thiamine pyrophosphate-dependent enzyme [Nitrolancea sp.]
MSVQARFGGEVMNRLDLTKRLIALLTHDEAVVGGIGNSNFDLMGAGHRPQNFYMLGSMGMAVPIGLGVALAQPERRVFVLDGDGSLLMNLNCLPTVAQVAPRNLTIVVWDNSAYQITGVQQTPTAERTDLVAVAQGAGILNAEWAKAEEHFEQLVERSLTEDGPHFIGVRVDQAPGQARPERDPVILKDRFMRGLGVK